MDTEQTRSIIDLNYGMAVPAEEGSGVWFAAGEMATALLPTAISMPHCASSYLQTRGRGWIPLPISITHSQFLTSSPAKSGPYRMSLIRLGLRLGP